MFMLAAPPKAADFLDVRNFNNTYEINIVKGKPGPGSNEMAKCQAVRLSKEWFITAAHCLKPICDGGCTIYARLLIGPGYEMDIKTEHASMSGNAVKLHEREKVNQSGVGYDIALINFASAESEYVYKDLENAHLIPQDMFMEKVKYNLKEYTEAREGVNFPSLLLLKAQTPKLLNRYLAVASIWDGKTEVLSTFGPVFYSPKNQYLYTNNFGIRQGISGSGVVTSSGELAGIVSSTGAMQQQSQEGTKALDYTFLSVFDEYALGFIRRNIGNVQYKVSDMTYIKVIPEEMRPLAFAVEKTVN
jgi:hypothetical protein